MGEHDVFGAFAEDDRIVGLAGGDLPLYEIGEEGQAGLPGPELRLIRERWGLTPAWLSAQTGTAERTFQRWEVSNAQIQARPGVHEVDAADLLLSIDQEAESIVCALLDELRAGIWDGVITIYPTDRAFRDATGSKYPASWHRAICAEIRARARREGYVVVPRYRE